MEAGERIIICLSQSNKNSGGIYCCLTADILTKVLQNCSTKLSGFLLNIPFLSKPVNLIGYHGKQKVSIREKIIETATPQKPYRGHSLNFSELFIAFASINFHWLTWEKWKLPFFSSGELIVYPYSGVRCRRRSRRCRRRRQQCLNIFSSETALPIKAKFYVEPPWEGGTKVYINGPGHMTKMAAMPVYGKNF